MNRTNVAITLNTPLTIDGAEVDELNLFVDDPRAFVAAFAPRRSG